MLHGVVPRDCRQPRGVRRQLGLQMTPPQLGASGIHVAATVRLPVVPGQCPARERDLVRRGPRGEILQDRRLLVLEQPHGVEAVGIGIDHRGLERVPVLAGLGLQLGDQEDVGAPFMEVTAQRVPLPGREGPSVVYPDEEGAARACGGGMLCCGLRVLLDHGRGPAGGGHLQTGGDRESWGACTLPRLIGGGHPVTHEVRTRVDSLQQEDLHSRESCRTRLLDLVRDLSLVAGPCRCEGQWSLAAVVDVAAGCQGKTLRYHVRPHLAPVEGVVRCGGAGHRPWAVRARCARGQGGDSQEHQDSPPVCSDPGHRTVFIPCGHRLRGLSPWNRECG